MAKDTINKLNREQRFLQDHAESAVRSTQWFRTAPANVQPSLKVKVRGIEVRAGRICWAFRLGDTNEID